MAGTAPRKLAPDEELASKWLNELVAFVEANQVQIDAHSGLNGKSGADGWTISYQSTPDMWIKITHSATDGSYSWVEQVPSGSGNFTDGFRKGYCATDPARDAPPDPAWEVNHNSSVGTGYYAEASRDAAVGRVSFRAGSCSGTGGGS